MHYARSSSQKTEFNPCRARSYPSRPASPPRVCGILRCHIRVDRKSLFRVRPRAPSARKYFQRALAQLAESHHPECLRISLDPASRMPVGGRLKFLSESTLRSRSRELLRRSAASEELCEVNAMHITDSVFIDDDRSRSNRHPTRRSMPIGKAAPEDNAHA